MRKYKARFNKREKPKQKALDLTQIIVDSAPFVINVWDANQNLISTSNQAMVLYGVASKEEYVRNFHKLSPEYQPCGTSSAELTAIKLAEAFESGFARFEWIHNTIDGKEFPAEISLVRFEHEGKPMLVTYTIDLTADKEVQKRELEMERHQVQADVDRWIRNVFEASPIGIAIYSQELKITHFNKAYMALHGIRKREDFFNTHDVSSPKSIKYADDLQPCATPSGIKLERMINTAIEKGYVKFEWVMQDAAGNKVPTEITLVRIDSSDSYEILSYIFDLREIEAARYAEREVYEVHRAIIEASPYAIGLWDSSGNITYVSEQAKDLFGIPDTQKIVEDLYSFSPPLQPCGTPSPEKAVMYAQQAYREGYARFEWLHFVNGKYIPTEVIYKRFSTKDGDRIVSFSIDLRDIKKAQDDVQEANTTLSMLLDASPMFIEIWDENLGLIDCNSQFMNLYGITVKDEFLELYKSLSPELQPCGTRSDIKLKQVLSEALECGFVHTEWMHITVDGTELPVEVVYVRLSSRGKPIIVGYNHDLRQIQNAMREMQRMEIVEESNRAKSMFLARMSHEIRTPITAVMGISEIQLQNPNLPPTIEESFAKIHNSSYSLLGIINDILDLSKIEAGKMDLIVEEYSAASMISDAAHLHLAYIGSKNINFRLKIDENLPSSLVGDSLRIGQVINNLMSNAFKYTDSGIVELEIGSKKDKDDPNKVMLIVTIRDTGMGMSEEQLSTLYEEYSRFHEHKARHISGTGLGMSIVYNLVQIMGATIQIQSKEGRGTTVTVRIPQTVSGSEVFGSELAGRLQKFEVGAHAVGKRLDFEPEPMPYGKVLVVDDIDANLYVATGLLAFYGMDIETCGDGYSAIDKIKAGKEYDIIFMDQMMPGINGTDTVRELRKLNYKLPIVALTANALIGQAEELISKGYDGYISKPIQTKHLNAVLLKYIRDKQPADVITKAREEHELYKNQQGNIHEYQASASLVEKLRNEFARGHKHTLTDLTNALACNDTEVAMRLAHTIKGLAGLILEVHLAACAESVEETLRHGGTPSDTQLANLESAFSRVLNSIGVPAPIVTSGQPLPDKNKLAAIFNELGELLDQRNAGALGLLPAFNMVPEAAILVRQIEEFDFEKAMYSLDTLRTVLDI